MTTTGELGSMLIEVENGRVMEMEAEQKALDEVGDYQEATRDYYEDRRL